MKNPLVTITLYTFNQEKYVQESVRAVLNQTYSPLEIIISDDCSTDRTVDIIKSTVLNENCRHKVILNVNSTNLGILRHVNKVVGMSNGEFIVGSAGDDISMANRVSVLVECWKTMKVSAVFSNDACIDDTGAAYGQYYVKQKSQKIGIDRMLKAGHTGVLGASLSYEKKVFESFGPLPLDGPYEDQIIPFQAAMTKGLYYLNEELMSYRVHADNVSQWTKMHTSTVRQWQEIRKSQLVNSIKRYVCWISYMVDFGGHSRFVKDIQKKMQIQKIELDILNLKFAKVGNPLCRLFEYFAISKDFIRCLILIISPKIYRSLLINRNGKFK